MVGVSLSSEFVYQGAMAFLISPLMNHVSPVCLQFTYFTTSSLSVHLRGDNIDSRLMHITRTQGWSWHDAFITLPPGSYHIYFEALNKYSISLEMFSRPEAEYIVGVRRLEISSGSCEDTRKFVGIIVLLLPVACCTFFSSK